MCTNVLENAHCERLNGTIKNEYLRRWNIDNFSQLKQAVEKAVQHYNNRRHHSLKRTPIAFETYVNELSIEQRPIFEVFTINKLLDNPWQTKLNFDA